MYSQELINEVKELYPDNLDMIKHAEAGSAWLGRYLDDNSSASITVSSVLLATSLEDLQKKAHLINRKRELYAKWCKEDPRAPNLTR